MRFSWKSLVVPAALVAAGAVGFGIARLASAETPDVAAVYEGKLNYKSYPLSEGEETAERGVYTATLILFQEGDYLGGTLLVGDEEETFFDLEGRIGPDGRFYLFASGEGAVIALTGKARGNAPNRKFICDGVFCQDLDLNELKVVVKENPDAVL